MIFFQAGVATYFIAFLSSMIGLGGGFLFIPLFTWMGFDYTTETLPTSLLLNLVTALIAQRAYIKKKLTVVKTAVVLGASAAMVAPFGAYATRFIDDNTLKMVFAVIVATIALQLIFFRANKDAGSLEDKRELSNVIAIPAGMFAGVMSGMLGVGVGGGFIIMPLLLFLRYPAKNAAATSSLVVFFSSASAFFGHLNTQRVDMKLALICIVSVMAGAKSGSYLMAEKCPGATVKKIFATVMIFIALKFFYDTILLSP